LSAARHFKINYGTLLDRIDNGWEINRAFTELASDSRKMYIVEGREFTSRREIARHYAMSVDVIRQREKQGFPIATIVKSPERRYRQELVKCCVHEFESKSELAKWLGISPSTLSYHLKKHCSVEAVCKHLRKCDLHPLAANPARSTPPTPS